MFCLHYYKMVEFIRKTNNSNYSFNSHKYNAVNNDDIQYHTK